MSIYTYNLSKNLCEILGTEFHEIPKLSDQELEKIPKDTHISLHGWNKSGWRHTEESKLLMSQSKIGKPAHNKGKPMTAKQKESLSNSMKGRIAHNKGLHNPLAAENGKKGAAKLSKTVTGRKRKYLSDGSWTWEYPNR